MRPRLPTVAFVVGSESGENLTTLSWLEAYKEENSAEAPLRAVYW